MWIWVAPVVAEEPPSAARLCAEAAAGTEVEVCLRLAARFPEQVDEVTAALGAHVDRGSSADRDLMFALLLLLSEPTAPDGARRLGELGDPRAVPPLVHAAETRELPVALAAVGALARHPAGLPPLVGWLLDGDRPLEVRVRAATELAALTSREAADALVDASRRRGLPPALRQAMRDGLSDHHPERLAELRPEIGVDGITWVTVSGALALGSALAVAIPPDRPELVGFGALAGTITGGTAGYMLGRALPVEAGDASFVALNGMVGGLGGLAIGAGLSNGRPVPTALGGLGGELVGLSAGALFAGTHPGNPADSVEAAAFGLAVGGAVGGALGLLHPDGDPRAASIGLGTGWVAGTAVGHALAPRIRVTPRDGIAIALLSGIGAGIGGLTTGDPYAPLAGGAAGAVAGFAIAGPIEASPDAIGAGAVGAGLGAMIGGGLASWARPNRTELHRGAAALTGAVGLGFGALTADVDPEPIDDRDVVLMAFAAGWIGLQTAGALQFVDGDPLSRPGPLLALPAVGASAVAALSSVLDVPVTHSSAAVSLGLFAATVGATAGELWLGGPAPLALIAGNGALIGGSIALSPVGGLTPTTVALADAGGLLGAGIGFATGRALSDDRRAAPIAALIGAGTGFVGGSLAGIALRRSGAMRNVALRWPGPPPRVALAPAPIAGRDALTWGLRVDVDRW